MTHFNPNAFTEDLAREIDLYEGRIVLLGFNYDLQKYDRVVWSFHKSDAYGVYARFKAAGLDSSNYVSYEVTERPPSYTDEELANEML